MTKEQIDALRADNARLADYEDSHERTFGIVFEVLTGLFAVVSYAGYLLAHHVTSLLASYILMFTFLTLFVRDRLFVIALQTQRTLNDNAAEVRDIVQQELSIETNWYEKAVSVTNWVAIGSFIVALIFLFTGL